MLNLTIEVGNTSDIDELEQLYDDLNDYLDGTVNYPGWRKGVYPMRKNAIEGIAQGNLYVAKHKGKIVGSVILSHIPEPAYHKAKWQLESDYCDVIVLYTFTVHPDYLKCGIGKALIEFAVDYGRKRQIRSIRLDVYEGNLPAIRLYEKCGFQYIDTVDLGLGDYGLDWFRLYERLL